MLTNETTPYSIVIHADGRAKGSRTEYWHRRRIRRTWSDSGTDVGTRASKQPFRSLEECMVRNSQRLIKSLPALALASIFAAAPVMEANAFQDEGTVRIGMLESQTGTYAPFGIA